MWPCLCLLCTPFLLSHIHLSFTLPSICGQYLEHNVDLLLAQQRTGPLVEVRLKQLQVVVEEEGPRQLLKGKDV